MASPLVITIQPKGAVFTPVASGFTYKSTLVDLASGTTVEEVTLAASLTHDVTALLNAGTLADGMLYRFVGKAFEIGGKLITDGKKDCKVAGGNLTSVITIPPPVDPLKIEVDRLTTQVKALNAEITKLESNVRTTGQRNTDLETRLIEAKALVASLDGIVKALKALPASPTVKVDLDPIKDEISEVKGLIGEIKTAMAAQAAAATASKPSAVKAEKEWVGLMVFVFGLIIGVGLILALYFHAMKGQDITATINSKAALADADARNSRLAHEMQDLLNQRAATDWSTVRAPNAPATPMTSYVLNPPPVIISPPVQSNAPAAAPAPNSNAPALTCVHNTYVSPPPQIIVQQAQPVMLIQQPAVIYQQVPVAVQFINPWGCPMVTNYQYKSNP